MKLDQKFIVFLLERIEQADTGAGVDFSDHTFVAGKGYVQEKEYLANFDLDNRTLFHLAAMQEEVLVEEMRSHPECSTFRLTTGGHSYLAEHRSNVWYKKLFRIVGRWMDMAMTSIFLPVIAAILTVLIMNYFGIGDGSISRLAD